MPTEYTGTLITDLLATTEKCAGKCGCGPCAFQREIIAKIDAPIGTVLSRPAAEDELERDRR